MSKALLKKSLAFVKSGRPEERERDSSQRKGKARSYVKEIRKKTNTAKSGAASGSNKSPPLTSDKVVTVTENNVLYLRKRGRMKNKTIKAVSESAVQKNKVNMCLTPTELAHEKKRIRPKRRQKHEIRKRQDKNPFSIFSIPDLSSS